MEYCRTGIGRGNVRGIAQKEPKKSLEKIMISYIRMRLKIEKERE